MDTEVITSNLARAVEVIADGGLAAVPTESGYMISCDGFNAKVVEKIYKMMGRPAARPVDLLVPGIAVAESVCLDTPRFAQLLAEAFWPGPLTMVMRKHRNVPGIVTAGKNTVAVRCPKNNRTLKFLELVNVPIAVCRIPNARTVDHVMPNYNGKIDCVIDGGQCPGMEPTIVDLDAFRILSQGALPEADIMRVLELD
jgi:L-threonylcarbamoyladenylate synthase